MRVYLSMCKHIIIEQYFSINSFLVKELSGINSDEISEDVIDKNAPLVEKIGREVQKVFKYVVIGVGPKNKLG
jgi:hypothetical protein